MAGHRPKNHRIFTGYISGWRLWLSILAIAFSLTLLSQAHRIIGPSQPPQATKTWLITAYGVLTPQQQSDIELELQRAIDQLPQATGLSYSLQLDTSQSNTTTPEATE